MARLGRLTDGPDSPGGILVTELERVRSALRLRASVARPGRAGAVLVYDLRSSPMTFGDFAFFMLVARWLQALGGHTDVVVLDDQLREDTLELIPRFQRRSEEFPRIAEGLSMPGRLSFHRMGLPELMEWSAERPDHVYHPPLDGIERRELAYLRSVGIVQYGARVASRRTLRRLALDPAALAATAGVEPPPGGYAVVSVRVGGYDPARDLRQDEFARQMAAIRERFPRLPVYIASDEHGTEIARGWVGDDPDVRFTKDLGTDFLGDVALAVSADFYVQFRGGGLICAVLASRTPFFIAARDINSRLGRSRSTRAPRWCHPLSVWRPPDEEAWPAFDDWLGRLQQPAGS